jgi:mannitol/fructose-specific phosphotransferase system IIA component (Ntr-type)
MSLSDFIPRRAIIPELKSKDRDGAIKELIQVIKRAYPQERINTAELIKLILEREEVGSTGLGEGVAIPHAKSSNLREIVGAFGRSRIGIDFNAVDGEPVYLIFLIVGPSAKAESYVEALQKIMQAIKRPNFCRFLRQANGVKEIEDLFKEVSSGVTVRQVQK